MIPPLVSCPTCGAEASAPCRFRRIGPRLAWLDRLLAVEEFRNGIHKSRVQAVARVNAAARVKQAPPSTMHRAQLERAFLARIGGLA